MSWYCWWHAVRLLEYPSKNHAFASCTTAITMPRQDRHIDGNTCHTQRRDPSLPINNNICTSQ